MKNLMLKIQNELRKIEGLRGSDVFLSPDLDLVPEGARMPCIGIKDGEVDPRELAGGVTEMNLPVQIGVYDKLVRDDKTIISVFDLAAEVRTNLKDNYLDGYVKEVETGKETQIRLVYRQGDALLRKIMNFQYYREE